MDPVVFIAGLSGVGKSDTAKWLEGELNFLHLPIDPDGIDSHDLRRGWNRFRQGNAVALATEIRRRMTVDRRSGAVLSFASDTIFDRGSIQIARAAEIITVIINGSPEQCMAAVRKRNGKLDEKHWRRKNWKAVETYRSPDFADVRIETFPPDGPRLTTAQIGEIIQRRITLR